MTKEKATAHIRVFPSTHRRLKIKAAKEGKNLPEYIDFLEREKLSTPHA